MICATWQDFLTGLQANGETLEMQSGIWDCNVLVPNGEQPAVNVSCSAIHGNGAIIKNLNGDLLANASNLDISNLHFLNYVTSGMFSAGSGYGNGVTLTNCTFAGIGTVNFSTANVCAFNIQLTKKRFIRFSIAGEATDSIIRLYAPAAEDIGSDTEHVFTCAMARCELILDAPKAAGTIRPARWDRCFMHGDAPKLTTAELPYQNSCISTCIFSTDDFPRLRTSGQYAGFLVGGTNEQLKDAAWLQSIGFL